MVHFRQRWFWGPIPILVVGGMLGTSVVANWGESLEGWLRYWPADVFVLLMVAWYWALVVRYSSRHVVVDDDGLWIDGELQARPEDVVAVALVQDPASALHLKRLDARADSSRPMKYWFGRDAWFHRTWNRVLEVEGFGRVAVPRSNDLARATGWHAVLVVSRRHHEHGRLRAYRQGWLIGTYREKRLGAALFTIAPAAEFVDHAPDVRGRLA